MSSTIIHVFFFFFIFWEKSNPNENTQENVENSNTSNELYAYQLASIILVSMIVTSCNLYCDGLRHSSATLVANDFLKSDTRRLENCFWLANYKSFWKEKKSARKFSVYFVILWYMLILWFFTMTPKMCIIKFCVNTFATTVLFLVETKTKIFMGLVFISLIEVILYIWFEYRYVIKLIKPLQKSSTYW